MPLPIPSLELQDLCKASPLPHSLQQAQIYSYDTEVFPFKEQVATILKTQGEFELLHNTEVGMTALAKGTKKRRKDSFVKTWRSSQGSEARKAFNNTLHQFVDTFISPRMSCEETEDQAAVGYQRVPTIRVVLPSDQPSTPLHCDADYHHPPAEVNWWLPLTSVAGTNSLYVESRPGKGDFLPVELEYGQVLRFYGNLCQHYTVPNTSGMTRVSLDLRVLALEHHDANWRDKMGRSSIFSVGKYYIRAGGEEKPKEIETSENHSDDSNILLRG